MQACSPPSGPALGLAPIKYEPSIRALHSRILPALKLVVRVLDIPKPIHILRSHIGRAVRVIGGEIAAYWDFSAFADRGQSPPACAPPTNPRCWQPMKSTGEKANKPVRRIALIVFDLGRKPDRAQLILLLSCSLLLPLLLPP